MKPNTDATPAQRTVLDHIKLNGPAQVADIAEALGITAVAVRQHLYALEDQGLVEFAEPDPTGARGRPSRRWRLREEASSYFADAHAELTVELIANIRDVFGERGLQKLIERRTDHQAADYLKALSGAASLRARARSDTPQLAAKKSKSSRSDGTAAPGSAAPGCSVPAKLLRWRCCTSASSESCTRVWAPPVVNGTLRTGAQFADALIEYNSHRNIKKLTHSSF
jgi:DNA-binding MarR family transcriptional regulator